MKHLRLRLAIVSAVAVLSFAAAKDPAPPLKETSITGAQISLARYKGSVVVFDFFATWCPPCRASIPHLAGLYKKYNRQGLQVVGLSVDDDAATLKKFAADQKIPYTLAVASDAAKTSYGIRSIPHIFIIDKRGNVVENFMGFDEEAGKAMEETIKRLLKEK